MSLSCRNNAGKVQLSFHGAAPPSANHYRVGFGRCGSNLRKPEQRLGHGAEFFFPRAGKMSCNSARCGFLRTPHGDAVDTPAFLPVGSRGAVKGVLPELIRRTGTQMILSNTYHLMLRPGVEVIAALGGLHRFMGWDGPILTDSGGFQVYSLAHLVAVSDRGVTFRSHIDGQLVELSPERAVELQAAFGSDVGMVLDHVLPLPCDPAAIRDATERTVRWAERSLHAARRGQVLFAIVQGASIFRCDAGACENW